jgi:hypothetical protein
MKLLLFFLLLYVFCPGLAQDKCVPSGLYTTLYAMVNEKPLPDYEISFKRRPFSSAKWICPSNLKIRPKLKTTNDLIWGFSDGENYYINSSLYDPRGKSRYSKIQYMGKRFMVFMAVMRLASPHHQCPLGIDKENGQMFIVTRDFVRDLIEEDHELLSIFNANPKTSSNMLKLVIRYDQRNY